MLSVFLAASALSALGSGKALWPTPEMYPPASWKAGNQGQTRLRLSPVADGPPRCDIVKSSGDSGLDKAACEIVLPRATSRNKTGKFACLSRPISLGSRPGSLTQTNPRKRGGWRWGCALG